MSKQMWTKPPLPRCPNCERPVRPGIECRATYCPYELAVKYGHVVLARPLRKRFIA